MCLELHALQLCVWVRKNVVRTWINRVNSYTVQKNIGDLNIFQKTDPSIQEAKWKENTGLILSQAF